MMKPFQMQFESIDPTSLFLQFMSALKYFTTYHFMRSKVHSIRLNLGWYIILSLLLFIISFGSLFKDNNSSFKFDSPINYLCDILFLVSCELCKTYLQNVTDRSYILSYSFLLQTQSTLFFYYKPYTCCSFSPVSLPEIERLHFAYGWVLFVIYFTRIFRFWFQIWENVGSIEFVSQVCDQLKNVIFELSNK